MARLARLVVLGLPHHVTQRGNGRARTFFADEDYALYRDLLAQACRDARVAVWAWWVMANHVHLIQRGKRGIPVFLGGWKTGTGTFASLRSQSPFSSNDERQGRLI